MINNRGKMVNTGSLCRRIKKVNKDPVCTRVKKGRHRPDLEIKKLD